LLCLHETGFTVMRSAELLTTINLYLRLCSPFPKNRMCYSKSANRTTLRGTAGLRVTLAYGTDQDPLGCSQRSNANRAEIPFQVCNFDLVVPM